ncbi:MAG TPA: DUF5916 domain-containing protein [Flavisolibacter sp.]|nr:DUF5916 domain-containing protein [Flavisolibacter sp.]
MRLLVFLILLCSTFTSTAQLKAVAAVRASLAPKIDGKLDDAAWNDAPIATDFIQSTPAFGTPASVKSVVRILYDNAAVYIGAYLYDDPELMRKQITSRDGEQRQDVDYFSVFFDTYNDKQNGFQFLVTPSNVQTDSKLKASGNFTFGEFGDKSWDAVWESTVSMQHDGWIVEMKIPYISLRFAKKDVQTWGLQFLRFTRRNNEMSYWNPVDPNENGFINQFGLYTDLTDIKPPLRLSFSPYVTGGVRFNPDGSANNKEVIRNGGMDVKYGINESFTLDATLIPDFGQVVSDNVINNLSPFEVRFQENRPFFTEGTEIFNKSGLFYSRRVGAIPGGYYSVQRMLQRNTDYELIRNPSVTQLYNAIKLSGRTKGKLGIGVFNAITAPMDAVLKSKLTGRDTTIRTEPLSNYNIIVLDQALKNRSSITFTNTNVSRRGEQHNANVSALDWSFFTKNNVYKLSGTGRYSNISGYSLYNGNINLADDTIRRNGQLYVKPYDGFSSALRFGKVSGKIQFSLSSSIESNSYNPNDLGYNQSPNEIIHDVSLSYRQLTATDKFLMYRYNLSARFLDTYKPCIRTVQLNTG